MLSLFWRSNKSLKLRQGKEFVAGMRFYVTQHHHHVFEARPLALPPPTDSAPKCVEFSHGGGVADILWCLTVPGRYVRGSIVDCHPRSVVSVAVPGVGRETVGCVACKECSDVA